MHNRSFDSLCYYTHASCCCRIFLVVVDKTPVFLVRDRLVLLDDPDVVHQVLVRADAHGTTLGPVCLVGRDGDVVNRLAHRHARHHLVEARDDVATTDSEAEVATITVTPLGGDLAAIRLAQAVLDGHVVAVGQGLVRR